MLVYEKSIDVSQFGYKRHILLVCVYWKVNDDNYCILETCVFKKL